MKVEVTRPLENCITKAYEKVISIIVSFFSSLKNIIYLSIYMEKELINIAIN